MASEKDVAEQGHDTNEDAKTPHSPIYTESTPVVIRGGKGGREILYPAI